MSTALQRIQMSNGYDINAGNVVPDIIDRGEF